MCKETEFSERYLAKLDAIIQSYQDQSKAKDTMGNHDEAVLEKIRFNVADVFRKMFVFSRDKAVPGGVRHGLIQGIVEKYTEPYLRLNHVYSHFLENISESWRTGLREAETHNDYETVIKEKVKLETHGIISKLFRNMYAEIWGEVTHENH